MSRSNTSHISAPNAVAIGINHSDGSTLIDVTDSAQQRQRGAEQHDPSPHSSPHPSPKSTRKSPPLPISTTSSSTRTSIPTPLHLPTPAKDTDHSITHTLSPHHPRTQHSFKTSLLDSPTSKRILSTQFPPTPPETPSQPEPRHKPLLARLRSPLGHPPTPPITPQVSDIPSRPQPHPTLPNTTPDSPHPDPIPTGVPEHHEAESPAVEQVPFHGLTLDSISEVDEDIGGDYVPLEPEQLWKGSPNSSPRPPENLQEDVGSSDLDSQPRTSPPRSPSISSRNPSPPLRITTDHIPKLSITVSVSPQEDKLLPNTSFLFTNNLIDLSSPVRENPKQDIGSISRDSELDRPDLDDQQSASPARSLSTLPISHPNSPPPSRDSSTAVQENPQDVKQSTSPTHSHSTLSVPPSPPLPVTDTRIVGPVPENIQEDVGSTSQTSVPLFPSTLEHYPAVLKVAQNARPHIYAALCDIFVSEGDERGPEEKAKKFLNWINIASSDERYRNDGEFQRQAHLFLLDLRGSSFDVVPSSLLLKGVTLIEQKPVNGGASADIYHALYNGQEVALKFPRIFKKGPDFLEVYKTFLREMSVCQRLQHPFILAFLGLHAEIFPPYLAMVSPWMRHGTILEHLSQYGYANIDELILEIAEGLEYLHSQGFVHGDLRAGNILIGEDGHVRIADYGLSVVARDVIFSSTGRGSPRWMAPELLCPDFPEQVGIRRTKASDVYALGCSLWEIYTGKRPFHDFNNDAAVTLQVHKGHRPRRLRDSVTLMSDELWCLIERCWSSEPTNRPSASQVVATMKRWRTLSTS